MAKTRHTRYKVGTCKLTVTVENEDKVRVHRKAVRGKYKDDSAFLRELIHEAVWDEPFTYASGGTVMVHIRRLRAKIEEDSHNPRIVVTSWGKGYRFCGGELNG